MRKLLPIITIAVLGLVMQACGQKGPLRLPERAKPVAVPAPASSTSDQTTSEQRKEP